MNKSVNLSICLLSALSSATGMHATSLQGSAMTAVADSIPAEVKAAEEYADSLMSTINLKEVTVEAQMSMAIKNGEAYIPKSRLKKASFDTFQLLQGMHIPSLYIDPVSQTISSVTREGVAFYINGIEATQTEVYKLQPKDVLRVEVLTNPIDPKYHGAKSVLNIVARKYAYGGFLNATASQTFIANKGDYSIYNKHVVGASTWQFTGSMGYDNTNGNIYESRKVYQMSDVDGTPWVLDRYISQEVQKRRYWTYKGGIQWLYAKTQNFNAQVTAGVNGHRQPHNDRTGTITDIVDGATTTGTSTIDFATSAVAPMLNFNVNYMPSQRVYLMAQGGVTGTLYNINDRRTESVGSSFVDYHNIADEKVVAPTGTLAAYYIFPNDTQLGVHVTDQAAIYNTSYTGTADTHQRFVTNTTSVRASYAINFLKQWSLSVNAAYEHALTRQNGVADMHENNVSAYLNISGRASTKHSFNFTGEYRPMAPAPSMYTDVVTQNSQFTATTGNPNLRWQKYFSLNFTYVWLMSNKFNLLIAPKYSGVIDCTVNGYMPHGNLMYRYPITSGDYRNLYVFLTLSYNITPSLSVDASATLNNFHQTGIFRQNAWHVSPNVSVNYNPNSHLMFHAALSGPEAKSEYSSGSYQHRSQWNLWLMATYTNANWGCKLSASPFGSYFKSITEAESTYAYTWDKTSDKSFGRYIFLSVSYTLDYGKRVNRSQSIRITDGNASTVR